MPAPGASPVVVLPRRERVQLEKRRARVEESVDALPGEELPACLVALDGLRGALGGHLFRSVAQFGDERLHSPPVVRVGLGGSIRAGIEDGHYQRWGSVLPMGIAYASEGT